MTFRVLLSKIYNEYYSKESLSKEIENIFQNETLTLSQKTKDIIYDYISQVLDKIKSHISNEAKRLSEELTSYSNNYQTIKSTLKNYKNSIYNQFYSAILSVINDFYSKIIKKFQTDYRKRDPNSPLVSIFFENFGGT